MEPELPGKRDVDYVDKEQDFSAKQASDDNDDDQELLTKTHQIEKLKLMKGKVKQVK